MNQNDQTLALHAGHNTTKTEGTRAVPIYQTTSYVFDDTDHAANLFSLAEPGYIYTRLNNPTADILEQRLASLEGGIAAVATSSGSAALATTLLTLLKTGDHIVASNSLYGGTYNLLNVTLPRYGITTTFVDPDDPDNFSEAINDKTRVVYIESIGNPKLDILDVESISKIAKKAKLPLIVDNTVATPYLLKPIDYGADIVIHSTTKYITGNGTSIGGVIIDAGTFNWGNGNYPEFTEPNPSYHGLNYHDALGNIAFIAKVRIEGLRDLGSAPSPFNSFQTIQGIETLDIRMKKHSENAIKKNNINNVVFIKNEIAKGYNEQSPFNAIIIEGAIQDVPLNIIDQLDEEGRLFAIVQEGEICSAKLFKKNGRSIGEQKLFNCSIPVPSMFMKKNSFSF